MNNWLSVDRKQLLQDLKNNTLEVTFTKVNGDRRVMTCTLVEAVLPPVKKDEPLTQKKIRAVNPEVITVWDINANGWRSFRVANVEKIRFTNEPVSEANSDAQR